MANTLTGKFLGAGAIRKSGDSFQSRTFWIDISDNPAYPNTPELQVTQDRVVLLDHLEKDDIIEVQFNVRGRKYTKTDQTTAVFTTLEAWKVSKIERTPTMPVSNAPVVDASVKDDLPF